MAAISNPAPSQRRKAGVQGMIKHNLKIDMTPMVDLGFLLITFFVITTELAKPTAMDLFMPKDGKPMPLGKSNALTVLLDQDKLYYYHGEWNDASDSCRRRPRSASAASVTSTNVRICPRAPSMASGDE